MVLGQCGAVLIGTRWYWVSIEQYWLIYDGIGSVEGGTGWYWLVGTGSVQFRTAWY